MKFDRTFVLLPATSHSELELHQPADEAGQILASWSAAFHPTILASSGELPEWASAAEPPEVVDGALVILPPLCEPLLPDGWIDRCQGRAARLVRGFHDREQLLAAATDGWDASRAGELTADFLALGLCHLIVELLTRKLRYMTYVDPSTFSGAVIRAAQAAMEDDRAKAKAELDVAFALLFQAREYYYPVESYLIDMTLVASSTVGEELARAVAGPPVTNLLVSGELLAWIAVHRPPILAQMRAALAEGNLGIIGGEYRELPLPLLPPEAIRRNLERGLAVYDRLLGERPGAFGRRRFGLTPALPTILRALGFRGAIHSTLDDGRFPAGSQCRIQWESPSGTAIEAVARVPLDAAQADVYLRLPELLGQSMDLDQLATLVLAHWPGSTSPWYNDVVRIARNCRLFGQFVTVNEYFETEGVCSQAANHAADAYRAPYLAQAVASGEGDPISSWVRYYARRGQAETAATFRAFSAVCCGTRDAAAAEREREEFEAILDMIDDRLDGGIDCRTADSGAAAGERRDAAAAERAPLDVAALDRRLGDELQAAARQLAAAITGEGDPPRAGSSPCGLLLLSPHAVAWRSTIETEVLSDPPSVAEPVVAAATHDTAIAAVVEVPALGFAHMEAASEDASQPARAADATDSPSSGSSLSPPKASHTWLRWLGRGRHAAAASMVEENRIRNEFFEVTIDPNTGAIRAVADDHHRGPRIAQQLAFRTGEGTNDDPGHESHYSLMAVDSIRLTQRGPVVAEVTAGGRLMSHHGQRLANYTQITRVWQGSRVVEVEVALEPQRLPSENPWSSYYAARFAWSDETAEVVRGVNMMAMTTALSRFESPQFVEVRLPKSRVSLLTGGLPYHCRQGMRRLDTLLIVRGESARRFRFGIGIDLPCPTPAALAFIAPPVAVPSARPSATHGWLFHIGAASVVATHWQPLADGARIDGVRIRLLETEGRATRCSLRAFAALRQAQRNASPGEDPQPLAVEGDRVAVDLPRYGWAEIELRFAR